MRGLTWPNDALGTHAVDPVVKSGGNVLRPFGIVFRDVIERI